MQNLNRILRPEGKLYLSVPIGPDVVAWNLHRRYGEFRLPKLLEGWEVVGRYGWDEEKLSAPRHFTRSYEPILVLSPINSSDGDSRSSSSNRNKEEL
mmetsp:Transcript_30153/g.53033  ORF Transcript_30153/g.53033 Transcript_30153/m.53033 type:complete len:97 (-) Transcript_30153:110-400(-)